MNKYLILIFMTTLLVVCNTANLNSYSVATADDFTAPLFNPAALSFGNADGIAFIGHYDEDYRTDAYQIIFNERNFSFVYGKYSGFNQYKLSLSHRLSRNVYFGYDIDWINSKISDADYGLSLLARPHNNLSLGVNAREVNRSSPHYILGAAIKPPGFVKMNRLVLTGEVTLAQNSNANNDNYELISRKIGLETRLLAGLTLSGNYDLNAETVGLNLSLSNKQFKTGSIVNFDQHRDLINGSYYVNFSDKAYPNFFLNPKQEKVFNFKLNKPIVEKKEQFKIGPFVIIQQQQTILDLIDEINKLRDEDSITGIIINNPQFSASYANLQQLERTFDSFRAAGKKIYVYADNFGNLQYSFLASIADEIYLNPNGVITLSGFSINIPYFNDLLDRLGIDIYDLKSHDYKTAFNMLSEETMTDYERETYEALLDTFYQDMANMLYKGRGNKLTAGVDEIINQGPYFDANVALEKGLVDKLIYEDELDKLVKDKHQKIKITKQAPLEKISYQWKKPVRKKVAYIAAVGNIHLGDGTPGKSIGSSTLSTQIRKARQDKSVKGLILRVDSGGGSAFASDVIAREIKLFRDSGKPVIITMGGAAASGGYYISVFGDHIFTESSTITGSIGVTGLIPNFNRMFDKLLINWENVKKGDNANLLSPFEEIDEQELQLLKDYIQTSYDKFIDTVAEGRNQDRDRIHQVAQGRVWSGKDAQARELVDDIGGIDSAYSLMKAKLNTEHIELIDFSHSYKSLTITLSENSVAKIGNRLNIPYVTEIVKRYQEYFSTFENEKALYIIRPFDIHGTE